MKFLFKAAQLKPILELTKKGTKFLIPYEGKKFGTKPSVWLVKDNGAYIMPCTHDRPFPTPKEHICYAQGFGPGKHIGGDDYCELIPIDSNMLDLINLGCDLSINITASHMDIGIIKYNK